MIKADQYFDISPYSTTKERIVYRRAFNDAYNVYANDRHAARHVMIYKAQSDSIEAKQNAILNQAINLCIFRPPKKGYEDYITKVLLTALKKCKELEND